MFHYTNSLNQGTFNVNLDYARPHQCPYCPKSFGRTDVLKCHIRIHTGEKPYVCNKCNRKFVQRSHLLKHYARFHVE